VPSWIRKSPFSPSGRGEQLNEKIFGTKEGIPSRERPAPKKTHKFSDQKKRALGEDTKNLLGEEKREKARSPKKSPPKEVERSQSLAGKKKVSISGQ